MWFNEGMNPSQPTQSPAVNEPTKQTPIGGKAKATKKPRRFAKRLIVIFASLLVLAGAAWASWEFLIPRLELTTFEGDGYTVSVPAEYQGMPSSGSAVFTEKGEPGDETLSTVSIQSIKYQDMSSTKQSTIKTYDDLYDEGSFTNSSNSESGIEIRDFKVSDRPFNGLESKQVSFSTYDSGEKIRQARTMVVFTDDAVYTVSVSNHKDDSELKWTASRILNSLKIAE